MSIAAFIKTDLENRIVTGRELPAQLTFDSLAEHYKVSYTPVRLAVAELVAQGLLEKGPNRRLKVGAAKPSIRKPQAAPQPVPPTDYYHLIANDLVLLSLKGESVFLREESTAEKYNTSRSVIRTTFHRLAAEGTIDHVPRRGWRLRAFRREEFEEFLEVREALELKALELARPKITAADLQQLLESNKFPVSETEPLCWNDSLHDYLIATAGNAYIKDFFQRQGRFHRHFCHLEYQDRAIGLDSIRQHREIIKAMLAKNWPVARKLLSRHIRHNHPILR